ERLHREHALAACHKTEGGTAGQELNTATVARGNQGFQVTGIAKLGHAGMMDGRTDAGRQGGLKKPNLRFVQTMPCRAVSVNKLQASAANVAVVDAGKVAKFVAQAGEERGAASAQLGERMVGLRVVLRQDAGPGP